MNGKLKYHPKFSQNFKMARMRYSLQNLEKHIKALKLSKNHYEKVSFPNQKIIFFLQRQPKCFVFVNGQIPIQQR